MKKIPQRTCVMCREKTDKRDLLRIIRTPEGNIEFDPTGKKNGRGAYICRKTECVDSIKNIKKIRYALDTDASEENLTQVLSEVKRYLESENKRQGEVNAGK